jgi:hypothetical protein
MRAEKIRILNDAGYAYLFDRQVYIGRKDKKVFSIEFVDDHSEQELRKRIREGNPDGRWRFYFNTPPSGAVKAELERAFG